MKTKLYSLIAIAGIALLTIGGGVIYHTEAEAAKPKAVAISPDEPTSGVLYSPVGKFGPVSVPAAPLDNPKSPEIIADSVSSDYRSITASFRVDPEDGATVIYMIALEGSDSSATADEIAASGGQSIITGDTVTVTAPVDPRKNPRDNLYLHWISSKPETVFQ